MGHHNHTVFKNSCLKVPINPLNRLPSASYERNINKEIELKKPIYTPPADIVEDKNPLSFREFYKSIPDYKDVNHLSNHEFYLKLENLRNKKQKLLLKCKGKIVGDESAFLNSNIDYYFDNKQSPILKTRRSDILITKKKLEDKYYNDKNLDVDNMIEIISDMESSLSMENIGKGKVKPYSKSNFEVNKNCDYLLSKINAKVSSPTQSISWNNELNYTPKFDSHRYKDDTIANLIQRPGSISLSKKSYSVPTSPVKKSLSPQMNLTVPQPFKMTERDEVNKMLSEMQDYSKELEYNFLQKDNKKKCFKANPVPIESRILLYDKIMEDQELRRSITKLQSTAELQAQMKPFKFTEREEKWGSSGSMGCRRLCRSNPHLALTSSVSESELVKTKNFKAKPVPKNLFSSYVHERMREDDFYRALNRRIRAEEMLKGASLPPSMAKREKSRDVSPIMKCHKYHYPKNNLEVNCMDEVQRKRRSKFRKKLVQSKYIREAKLDREMENLKSELVLPISKNVKMMQEEELKKIYGSNSSEPTTSSSSSSNRPKSSVDGHSVNRSNLAAILRIESSKKKLESDILKRFEEERYQSEIKWRDSVLRRKPAWKSIKYSHAEDLAMRLQMRRDEERLRREQFLHDMELMYGRVHRQPLMFERCYSPRKGLRINSYSDVFDVKSKEKPKSALSKRSLNTILSPSRSRKVSINETAETIGDDIEDYSYKDSYEDNVSKSSDEIPESFPEQFQADT